MSIEEFHNYIQTIFKDPAKLIKLIDYLEDEAKIDPDFIGLLEKCKEKLATYNLEVA